MKLIKILNYLTGFFLLVGLTGLILTIIEQGKLSDILTSIEWSHKFISIDDGIVEVEGLQYKVDGVKKGMKVNLLKREDDWHWSWNGGRNGLICNFNTPYIDAKNNKMWFSPHDQEKACYMALTCFRANSKKDLDFEGVKIFSTRVGDRCGTWEQSWELFCQGMSNEQALVKLVKRFGKKGVLKIHTGPFITPISCTSFDVIDTHSSDGNITITLKN